MYPWIRILAYLIEFVLRKLQSFLQILTIFLKA